MELAVSVARRIGGNEGRRWAGEAFGFVTGWIAEVTSWIREDGHGYGAWSLRDLRVELGRCSWWHCGRIAAAKERKLERILIMMGLQRCWS